MWLGKLHLLMEMGVRCLRNYSILRFLWVFVLVLQSWEYTWLQRSYVMWCEIISWLGEEHTTCRAM